MKKHTIWKSFDLFTKEEENDFLECIKEENEDLNDDELNGYAYRLNDNYFDDDFGKRGNVEYSTLKGKRCIVKGSLGLWNGIHDIIPREFGDIRDAIYACLEDSNDIYEDRYGNLHVDAYHHDGCNRFVIKLLTSKGERCVRFRETI